MKIDKKKKSVGVLFPHQKTKERSPDMTGQVTIQCEDLKQLAEQVDTTEGKAIGNIALWFYQADPDNGKGPYVSLQLTPPYRPRRKALDVDPETNLEEFFKEVRQDNRDEPG